MEGIERSVQRGIAAYRWLAFAWMATVLALARGNLDRPVVAVLLLAAALAVTVWLTVLLDRHPARLASPLVVGVEVGVALAIQLADGVVYARGHIFSGHQPLGVGWPIAAILSAGVGFGPAVGAATGAVMAAGRTVSSVLAVEPVAGVEPWIGDLTPAQVLSLATTAVLYALAGGIAGYAARLIREAQSRVAEAERAVAHVRAREEVARRLHDGVLQTLAIVERRAQDDQLARLARDQERELRAYLAGTPDAGVSSGGRLGDALRRVADRFETAFGTRAEVLAPDDLPDLDEAVLEAICGAVGEALTNAGKHAHAERVTIYAEPEDGTVFVSVRDDGVGADPDAIVEGLGLPSSIRGRIQEVGGEVSWTSAPGRGTEVRLSVPVSGGAS